jgi:hypothetical protein
MRFPEWARNDKYMRLDYMCQIMSVYAHPDGSLYRLSKIARINYSTLLKAKVAGQMTYRVATSLSEKVSGSGIKATWLMAPDLMNLDEDGEVIE